MTAVELLGLISAALLAQLAVGIAVVVRRRHAAAAVSGAAPVSPRRSGLAWDGWREFRVVRRAFEDAERTQCSFDLQPLDGVPLPDFRPGQFLTFALDVGAGQDTLDADRRVVTRCYSLSDAPQPTHYRVTIKRVPAPAGRPDLPPGVSSNHFHDHVQVGDRLRVKAPSGRFGLDGEVDADAHTPLVLIGGGVGITPMVSMLRASLRRHPQRAVQLFYGVRNGREHAFKGELRAMAAAHPALSLHVVYSRPGADDEPRRDFQHAGHVDIELLRRCVPPGRHRFYVCGPPSMMASLVPALAQSGIAREDLHFEAFGPASVKLPGAPAAARPEVDPFAVQFRRSGRTLAWEGGDASLLDFAQRHGIDVDAGCRSGGCGACETRVVEGSVAYEHAPEYDVAPGHCLLCVGRPATALVLEL